MTTFDEKEEENLHLSNHHYQQMHFQSLRHRRSTILTTPSQQLSEQCIMANDRCIGEEEEAVDPYGFPLAVRDGPTVEAWTSFLHSHPHLSKTARQRTRWEGLMYRQKDRLYVFPPLNTTVRRALRKGLCEDLRGPAWFFYSGAQAAMAARPHLYGRLAEQSTELTIRPIDFPEAWLRNDRFKGILGGGKCPFAAVNRILTVYGHLFPDRPADYAPCDLVTLVVATLLLVVGDEERVFWIFHRILTAILPPGLLASTGQVEGEVLGRLLAAKLPRLHHWLMEGLGGAGLAMLTAPWMQSLFIGQLPFPWALRILDALMADGWKVMLRISWSLFYLNQSRLLECECTPLQLALVIRALPAGQLDIYRCFEVAWDEIGSLSGAWIEGERAVALAEWKSRHAIRRFSMAAPPSPCDPQDVYAPRLSLFPNSGQAVAASVVQVNDVLHIIQR